MIDCVSIEQMRKFDKNTIDTKISSVDLMLKAAKSVYDELDKDKIIYIISGSGNNGGDGIALTKLLVDSGYKPSLFLISNKVSKDSEYFLNQIRDYENIFDISKCDYKADIIVDCILGTGFHGMVEEPILSIINKINKSKAYVVSVDIPSGLNGNNGIDQNSVKADKTIAVQFYKYGHFLNDAKDFVGELVVKDIGIEKTEKVAKIIEKKDIIFPKRKQNTNKGDYGKAIIISGCKDYYGAVKLANMGVSALRSGAGLNVIAVPSSMAPVLGFSIIESSVTPLKEKDGSIIFDKDEIDDLISKASSFAIGMGMGKSKENKKIIEYILENFNGPVLIDADGLNSLDGDLEVLRRGKNVIITPHPKELSRLINVEVSKIIDSPVEVVEKLAMMGNITILYKGATTIIANKSETYFMIDGSASMAKGGQGDTLSGVILGLLSQGFSSIISTYTGAYLCAWASKKSEKEFSEYGVLASDVAREIANITK